MRISEYDLNQTDTWQCLSALVEWESVDRPPQRIEFRVPTNGLPMRLHAAPFVLAAAVPAMAAGETRIASTLPLDPVLIEGIPSALAIIKHWCRDMSAAWSLPMLECEVEVVACRAAPRRATASFFSGGVDATFTLLRNHSLLPAGTAGRIDCVLTVFGLDLGYRSDRDDRAAYDQFVASAAPWLDSQGVRLVPVETNLRQLDPRPGFWGRAFNGFALSAIAQLFPDALEQVHIGTSGERLGESVQFPWGSHPVLHPYLSSSVVQGRSPYVEFSRLRRLAWIAKDAGARAQLRVCFASRSGALNCGVCEKCVRTRLGLLLCDADPQSGFDGPPLSAELIGAVSITSNLGQAEHEELRDALRIHGNLELAAAEDDLIRRWLRYEHWRQNRGFKGWLRRKREALQRRFPPSSS
ncbi:hypothetical protein [Niveibacterium sp.]|uniref:hypothetical protein n=1 Tax=Niveibacterium sp. TaxID=2017444 RepID=UPI0035B38FBD